MTHPWHRGEAKSLCEEIRLVVAQLVDRNLKKEPPVPSANEQRLLVVNQQELKEIVKAAIVEAISTQVNQHQAAPLRVNIVQLAKMLGKSQRTIAEWKRLRKIPYEKVGHNVLFDVADVNTALKKFRRTAAGY